MRRFIFIGFVLVAVLTACTKEHFEYQEDGQQEGQSETRLFEEKVKAFALSSFTDMSKGRGATPLGLPNVESIEPITSEIIQRTGTERDTVAYIVNFDQNASMIITGSRILPLTTVAICDSRMAVIDTIQNKGLATFMKLLPNYYYQEIGQRIIDFGLATREQVASYTRGDLLQFTDQLEPLGDIPSPLIPININDYLNGTITSSTEITYNEVANMLTVNWGQSEPFNLFAEVVLCNGQLMRAPAGCVAIAVAQITTRHQHPKVLNGQILDWTVLSKPYALSFVTPYEKNTIASYIRIIGDFCENDWDCGATSAYSSIVPRAFRLLGYTTSGLRSYGKNRVNESRQRSKPVYISGNSSAGGHGWAIDGSLEKVMKEYYYNNSGALPDIGIRRWMYFHCNWGWDGTANGYFLDNVFNTSEGYSYYGSDGELQPNQSTQSGYYFNARLKVVTNITPVN